MISFAKILVPTDLGEPSRHALTTAVELAKKFDAQIVLVHVFDVPMSYAGMDLSPRDLLAPLWQGAKEQLDVALADVRKSIPNATLTVSQGTPWREILAAIEREHADLVVVGTHGRRGIGRALLGSVAEKLVRLSPVPVLTVRTRDEKDDGE